LFTVTNIRTANRRIAAVVTVSSQCKKKKKKIQIFSITRVSPGKQLTKKPEDSGYEIAEPPLLFVSGWQ